MFEDVKNRVVVVTGGGRGLGLSIAEAFAAAGASVGLIDLLPTVEETAADLGRRYGVATAAAAADVTDQPDVERAFATIRHQLGTPDVLLGAAGITDHRDAIDLDPESWRRLFAVNVDGMFFACQEFARPLLTENRTGSAILISSMSAFVVNRPQNQAAYNASKAAVAHLGASLGIEWARNGIRVNCIAPGYFLSEMTRRSTEQDPELAKQWTDSIPVGRMGEPEDLHGLALYLASDASSYVTGQNIIIDGGYTLI